MNTTRRGFFKGIAGLLGVAALGKTAPELLTVSRDSGPTQVLSNVPNGGYPVWGAVQTPLEPTRIYYGYPRLFSTDLEGTDPQIVSPSVATVIYQHFGVEA